MSTFMLNPGKQLTFMLNGELRMILADSPLWDRAMKALQTEDWDALSYLGNTLAYIAKWSKGLFVLRADGNLYWGDEIVHKTIRDRILYCIDHNMPLDNILKFYERAKQNPSWFSIEQLYGFLETTGISIDTEGFIIACKAVRADWLDIYSGTISNAVGNIVSVPREQVECDPERACAQGLHVGSIDYVTGYMRSNSRLVFVRVDPIDVVSVPRNHGCQKMRVCRYQVLNEFHQPHVAYLPPVIDEDNCAWGFVYDYEEEE